MCQTRKKSLSIPRIQSGVSLACVSVVLLEGVCLRADVVEGRGNEAKGEGSFFVFMSPDSPCSSTSKERKQPDAERTKWREH